MPLKEMSDIISDEEAKLIKDKVRENRERSHERLKNIVEKL